MIRPLYICLLLFMLAPLLSIGQHNADLIGREKSFHTSLQTTVMPAHFFILASPVSLSPFVYDASVPRGAVFCRMESKVYERYNIWFKIHAGAGEGPKPVTGY
jgi:hypothetical protein